MDTKPLHFESQLLACQTVSNACATIALLNIVNNVPDIDLGERMAHFKGFCNDFTPALRGTAVANFEFLKRIHNSFARFGKLICIKVS